MKYQKDYYKVLGIKRNATQEEIKRAYRQLVMLNHPDRNSSYQATERMQELNEAYAVIGDSRKRPQYDFEYIDPTVPSQTQTRDSSYSKMANLDEFALEEIPIPVFHVLYFLVVVMFEAMIISLLSAIPPLTRFMHSFGPSIVIVMTPLILLGIGAAIAYWKSSEHFKRENQCPKCLQVWGVKKLNERSMGIFRKARGNINGRSVRLVTCEKYDIHCKCKYCSYEWLFIKIRTI